MIWEYETVKLKYKPPTKTYTPDFLITTKSGKVLYVEAKGYFKSCDRAKMLLVRDQNPELDIRFLFARATNKIHPRSNTNYGGWCSRHGFIWAESIIPSTWLEE